MAKKFTQEEFIKKANLIHDNKYDYSKVKYINSRSKVIIVCKDHGEFTQRANAHLQGNGCPECQKIWSDEHKYNHIVSARKSRGFTTEEWIKRARLVHDDTYDYSKVTYINQRTKVDIICSKHGVFSQKPDSHLKGHGCKKCGEIKCLQSGDRSWSEDRYEKIAKTCLERYGTTRYLDSDEGRKKLKQIKSTKEHRRKMSNIILSEEVQSKIKKTNLQRYGAEFATQTDEVLNKINNTKRQNGSFSTSKKEDMMYDYLVDEFGFDNVYRQYNSKFYPYNCDFYIKHLDLYIELNASWTHGGHWFDEDDKQDIEKLLLWETKAMNGSKYYANAIDVWTCRDLEKKHVALSNNLNYLAFWNNDLTDFLSWINSDNLTLNNIE